MSSQLLKSNDSSVVRWFPLRIFHSSTARQSFLRSELEKEELVEETYVPLKLVDAYEQEFAPALLNYIFVRTSLINLRQLKELPKYTHLRYVVNFDRDEHDNRMSKIAFVTDWEMSNFQKVIEKANDQVICLKNNSFAMRPGQKVVVTEGEFAGVEGTLKSIKKHICVIVAIEGVVALAITGIHRKHVKPIV